MGDYKNKTYPLRIDNDLRIKVEYIAKIEDRKVSQQYERIIRNYVTEYEAVNGDLVVNSDGTITHHPIKEINHHREKSLSSKTG